MGIKIVGTGKTYVSGAFWFAALLTALVARSATAGDDSSISYSPYAGFAGEKQVFWGDTHLHTTLSLDARAFGVTLDQETAYQFARGEQVRSSHGENVKLSRPLDFLVVTDHSDAMGSMSEIIAAKLGDKHVPMGGSLEKAPGNTLPLFTVCAMKDPIGANLDRIQIVKGWLGPKGERQESVVDVAWSGKRKKNRQGKLAPVGNTENPKTASHENSIGARQLSVAWQDPDFDPSTPVYYYARVLEILTPRWTAYDAYRFSVSMSKEVPMTTQERAYTSPIWYQP